MNMTKMLCRVLIVLMAWMPFHVAQAGMIGTDRFVGTTAQADRAAVLSIINRADVASQFQQFGIDTATANERVAAMSDQEVSALAGKLNTLPVGADSGTTVLVIVLVGVLLWWIFWRKR